MNVAVWSVSFVSVFVLPLLVSRPAEAFDHALVGTKLAIVDKLASAGKAKVVFVSRDGYVRKGTGTDAGDIQATLNLAYDGASGSFAMPAGLAWLTNTSLLAKYVNRSAPTGGGVRTSVIKPLGDLLKVVGKSLGDVPIDISQPPTSPVYAAYTIVNAGEEHRYCTVFTNCTHRESASVRKIVCTNLGGDYDGACIATTPSCIVGRFQDLGTTVLDSCTNLEWEKKTTLVGSGETPADPNDVDNLYQWSGRCSIDTSKLCQPSAAAETACKAQTPSGLWAFGCEQCVGGEGSCTFEAGSTITTVWEWVSQLNAASFAGHADWRLPTSAGFDGSTEEPTELESIVDFTQGHCHGVPGACVAPLFGPTQGDPFGATYWSSSPATLPADHDLAAAVNFDDGSRGNGLKWAAVYVRAVRDAAP